MRLWHLLHEALTETTLAQPIMSLYPQPNSMLYPQGINRKNFKSKIYKKKGVKLYDNKFKTVKIVDDGLNFYFYFYFLFYFSFLFLFLEQLRLGVISHAVTSVTT